MEARTDGVFVLGEEKIKITSSDFAGQLELEADLERSSGALHFHPGTVVNQELVRRNWKSISREFRASLLAAGKGIPPTEVSYRSR